MINGDVMDFLNRMDRNEWTVLYKGKCYFFEANYLPDCDRTSIEIQSWKAHTDDHIDIIDETNEKGELIDFTYLELPEFPTYHEAIRDFLKRKLFDDNTKTFFQVQNEREWLG